MTVKTWGTSDKQISQVRFLLTSIFISIFISIRSINTSVFILWSTFSLRNIWVFLFLNIVPCGLSPQSLHSVKIYSNPRPCPAPPRQHQWCTCPQQLETQFQSALPAHMPQTLAMYVGPWRSLVHIVEICVSLSHCSYSQEKYPKAMGIWDFSFSSQLSTLFRGIWFFGTYIQWL